jgi:hypothetical protein
MRCGVKTPAAASPLGFSQSQPWISILELTGKIVTVLPEKTGTSSRGPWRKQEYVIEIPGDYPKQVCFMVWGDKIDQFSVVEGETMTVHFDLESREYNGRWYTDVKAWRVERPDGQGDAPDAPPPPDDGPPPVFDDDIPF